MGAADFRVGGRIFATLASEKQGFGNLKLTPEQQAEFVADLPEIFLPVHWGMGTRRDDAPTVGDGERGCVDRGVARGLGAPRGRQHSDEQKACFQETGSEGRVRKRRGVDARGSRCRFC